MKKFINISIGVIALFLSSISSVAGVIHIDIADNSSIPGATIMAYVKEDGKTAKLSHVILDHSAKQFEIGGMTLINYSNGWRYTLEEIGSGLQFRNTRWLYESYSDRLIQRAIIKEGIYRINDYAFYCDYDSYDISYAPQEIVLAEGNNISYIGVQAFDRAESPFTDAQVSKLWINMENDCRIEHCCGWIAGMTIGDVSLSGDGKAMFTSCHKDSLIRCTSVTPPRIDTPLFEDKSAYDKARLIVPAEAKDIYMQHDEWGKFSRILSEQEYEESFGFPSLGENEFQIKYDNGIYSLYRINDDLESVTLLHTKSRYSIPLDVDCNDPVIHPVTGKSYTLTGIEGKGWAHYDFYNILNSQVTHIGDDLELLNYMPRSNRFKYIGRSVCYNANVGRMYINDGCTFAGGGYAYFVTIGNDVKLLPYSTYSNSKYVWGRNTFVRCLSPIPPEISVNNPFNFLIVPKGSLEAYQQHKVWGKAKHIIEGDAPVQTVFSVEPLDGSGKKFNARRYHDGHYDTFTFGVNPDGCSVSLLKIVDINGSDASCLQLDVPVTDPESAIEYPITAIGDGNGRIGVVDNWVVSIPPNIRQLNSYCFSNMDIRLNIGEENNLEAIHPCIVTEEHLDTLVIKSNCLVNDMIGLRPKYTRIHARETLGVMDDFGNYKGTRYWDIIDPIFDPDGSIYDFSTDLQKEAVIECTSVQPPLVLNLFKQNSWYGSTTLIVPKGCYEIYRAAPQWGKIQNIIESDNAAIDEIEPDTPPQLAVAVTDGGIAVAAPQGTLVSVIDLMGRRVAHSRTSEAVTSFSLPSGIFIVTAPGMQPRKVRVK